MDRLEEWRIFAAVAAHRSFVEAARSLRRSPQSATRAVAALEARLGTRLLNRTTRSVSPTSDGERYLERGRRLVSDFDELEQPADAATELKGLLSVTAPVLFGQLHVVPIVVELLELHPRLDVRLDLVDRVVSLADEGIDVAVRIGALQDSSLRVRVLGQVRPIVCASPDYLSRAGRPRNPKSLGKHACISFIGTTRIADRWSFPAKRREKSVTVRPRLVVNTGQAAIDAALSGLGLVRVLSYQVDELVRGGKLQVVLQSFEPEPVPVHLVQLPGVQSRAATALTELATKRLRAKLGMNR